MRMNRKVSIWKHVRWAIRSASTMARGRPSRLPCAPALFSPARTLSWITMHVQIPPLRR